MAFTDLFPSLENVLDARERRWNERVSLSGRQTVLSVTPRLPYGLKISYPDLPNAVRDDLQDQGLRFLKSVSLEDGIEHFYVADKDPVEVKKAAVGIEDRNPLGKFLDLDVIHSEKVVSRRDFFLPERKCVVCGEPAWKCIKEKRHTEEEIRLAIESRRIPSGVDRTGEIARLAAFCSEEELRLPYKPGLVTPISNGSHKDMDFPMMLQSLVGFRSFWQFCAEKGAEIDSPSPEHLAELRKKGLEAEQDMLLHSGGVNTYKGLIYLLGILSASASYAFRLSDFASIFTSARMFCAKEMERGVTDFSKARSRGIVMAGARGETFTGFPTVRKALVFLLRQEQDGVPMQERELNTLLFLISITDDSNIVGRGGVDALMWIRSEARKILDLGGVSSPEGVEAYRGFAREVVEKNLSPGGSADLLTCTLFLHRLLPLFKKESV